MHVSTVIGKPAQRDASQSYILLAPSILCKPCLQKEQRPVPAREGPKTFGLQETLSQPAKSSSAAYKPSNSQGFGCQHDALLSLGEGLCSRVWDMTHPSSLQPRSWGEPQHLRGVPHGG